MIDRKNFIPFKDITENQGCGKPIKLTKSNYYHLIFLKKEGELIINFNKICVDGYNIIILCPDEVFMIKDYEKIFIFSFLYLKELGEFNQFIKVFGSQNKIYKLPEYQDDSKEFIRQFIQTDLINTKEKLAFLFDFLAEKDIPKIELQARNFITLIHEFYKIHHRIDFYAKQLSITPKNVSELFYELELNTPHEILKERIIIEAKRLLVFTQKTAKEICYDLGFNDPTYFSRFFKKNVGTNTKVFRNNWEILLSGFETK